MSDVCVAFFLSIVAMYRLWCPPFFLFITKLDEVKYIMCIERTEQPRPRRRPPARPWSGPPRGPTDPPRCRRETGRRWPTWWTTTRGWRGATRRGTTGTGRNSTGETRVSGDTTHWQLRGFHGYTDSREQTEHGGVLPNVGLPPACVDQSGEAWENLGPVSICIRAVLGS